MNKFLDFFKYKSNIDKDINFRFNVYNYKKEGMLTIALTLVVPLFFAIILKIILEFGGINFPDNQTKTLAWQIPAILIQIVCAICGLIFLYKKDTKLFFKTSAWGIFSFIIAPTLFSLFFSLIVTVLFASKITAENQIFYDGFVSIISMMVSEILIAFFMLRKVMDLRQRIISTLEQNKISLIKVVFVVCLVVVGVTFLVSFISTKLDIQQSDNQESLMAPLLSASKSVAIVYAVLLFIFTVIVAPFVEELTMRDSLFTAVGNKWTGFVVSSVFFALTHVYLAGDIQNIWMYILPSILFSLTFVYTDGNVTYTWLIHAITNLVSFIVTIVQVMG